MIATKFEVKQVDEVHYYFGSRVFKEEKEKIVLFYQS